MTDRPIKSPTDEAAQSQSPRPCLRHMIYTIVYLGIFMHI